ncbi:LysR family transcriptional regulator [Burkholderia sp. Ac-20379]|uniref:LysR family transcriptional regulator n=1 Tax=Burkholderia sp. Ac-20379 TaxID=2703900 RepID=UPI00197F0302|nr:LysR family transcriptional regulator [Burkholderia sp. Ac-20379]MBN3725387.1 LysR family transcriptional regulator [Burkholderia sp. Ac-20379]
MPTLENMRLFVKVVETGSFTKAAQAAHVATPQVSRAISSLETQLRVRLLNRTTRRIAVTEAGERYLVHCRQILDLVDEAEAEASGAARCPSGRLRVHATAGFGRHYLVPRLARYRERYPEVTIDLTLAQRVPDLVDEGYDLAVVVASELGDSTLVAERIGTTYSVLCASPAYLARTGVPETVADLHDHVCLQLVVPNASTSGWQLEGATSSELFAPEQEWPFVVNVADAMADALRSGMGIGPLPISTALDGLRDGSLARVLPAWRLRSNGIHALYPSRRHLEAKVRTFIDYLRAVVPPVLELESHALSSLTGAQIARAAYPQRGAQAGTEAVQAEPEHPLEPHDLSDCDA